MLLPCLLPVHLRDEMPQKPQDAVNWMMEKLIKAVGEAKMLAVRLHGVKHQQPLCNLTVKCTHFMCSEAHELLCNNMCRGTLFKVTR